MKNIIEAKKIWEALEDVLIDDNECILNDFLHFPAGTERYEIWLWIESKYGVSIGNDLMV